MFKKAITFENYDGETVTENHWFHISKATFVEMEVEHPGGMYNHLVAIVNTEDRKKMIQEFKSIILASYGIRDGGHFRQSEEITRDFTQTAAYSALFMELSSDEDAAADFVNNVIPKNMGETRDQDKPTMPPPPPSTAIGAQS